MSLLDTVKELARQALARVDTHALYEGEVVQQRADGSLDVKLDDQRFGPGWSEINVAWGIPGVTATVPQGTRVAVGFHDERRSRPVLRHFLSGTPLTLKLEATQNVTITSALAVDLGEAPRLGVARQTDAVQCGPFSGAIVGCSARVKAGL